MEEFTIPFPFIEVTSEDSDETFYFPLIPSLMRNSNHRNSSSSTNNEQSESTRTSFSENDGNIPVIVRVPRRTNNSNERNSFQYVMMNFPGIEVSDTSGEEEFQNILNRMMQLHEPKGTPPTSDIVIEHLKEITLTHDIISNQQSCTICCEEFKLNNRMENEEEEEKRIIVELPCSHIFDKECVTHWLKQHNTCPVCRYELPVDDPEYETKRKERMSARLPSHNEISSSSDIDTVPISSNVSPVDQTLETQHSNVINTNINDTLPLEPILQSSNDISHIETVSPTSESPKTLKRSLEPKYKKSDSKRSRGGLKRGFLNIKQKDDNKSKMDDDENYLPGVKKGFLL